MEHAHFVASEYRAASKCISEDAATKRAVPGWITKSPAFSESQGVSRHTYVRRKPIKSALKRRAAVGRFVNTINSSSKKVIVLNTQRKHQRVGQQKVIDVRLGPGISVI